MGDYQQRWHLNSTKATISVVVDLVNLLHHIFDLTTSQDFGLTMRDLLTQTLHQGQYGRVEITPGLCIVCEAHNRTTLHDMNLV